MGPAAVLGAINAADVSQVVVADVRSDALDACMRRFVQLPHGEKVTTALLDVRDRSATVERCAQAAVVVSTLPWPEHQEAIWAAITAQRPIVGIARPPYDLMPELCVEVAEAQGQVMIGCGLEPGLTEIVAHHMAQQLDRVDELYIWCGGIPEQPEPPLGYKIVFGGGELPIQDRPVYAVQDGLLVSVPRFSGVETITFDGVGVCEAWFDGMLPWLMDLPAFQQLRVCAQKTIRWPGFADKIAILREMGLISTDPVSVDGVMVVPKRMLDAVIGPRVKLREGERDLVLLRVEARGARGVAQQRIVTDMVAGYDTLLGFTAMSRTTSLTAISVARMIGRGEIRGYGVLSPEQYVTGPQFERLRNDLAEYGLVLRQAQDHLVV